MLSRPGESGVPRKQMSEKLSVIRESIPDRLRKRKPWKTEHPLARDALLYCVGFALACLGFPWNVPGGLLTGMAVAALFIWAQLPSGHLYALWIPGHNILFGFRFRAGLVPRAAKLANGDSWIK